MYVRSSYLRKQSVGGLWFWQAISGWSLCSKRGDARLNILGSLRVKNCFIWIYLIREPFVYIQNPSFFPLVSHSFLASSSLIFWLENEHSPVDTEQKSQEGRAINSLSLPYQWSYKNKRVNEVHSNTGLPATWVRIVYILHSAVVASWMIIIATFIVFPTAMRMPRILGDPLAVSQTSLATVVCGCFPPSSLSSSNERWHTRWMRPLLPRKVGRQARVNREKYSTVQDIVSSDVRCGKQE